MLIIRKYLYGQFLRDFKSNLNLVSMKKYKTNQLTWWCEVPMSDLSKLTLLIRVSFFPSLCIVVTVPPPWIVWDVAVVAVPGTGDLLLGWGEGDEPKEDWVVWKVSFRCIVLSPTPLTITRVVAGFLGDDEEAAVVVVAAAL